MEENENRTVQEGTIAEVQEEAYKSGSIQYIDSREVAEMVGKEHNNLLKDIRRYMVQMGKVKIDFSNFFIESSYSVDGQSRLYPCYLVTEKGCEFIAHKMTSEKGTVFTAAYIDRFHEMKETLEGQPEIMLQFMKQQMKALQVVTGMVEQMGESVKKLSTEVEKMKYQRTDIPFVNIFSVHDDVIKQRMKTLNNLVDRVAELCDIERNKVLHQMYKTLDKRLGILLDSYKSVYRSETGRKSASMIEVIACNDWIYGNAVDMNGYVIKKKDIYG